MLKLYRFFFAILAVFALPFALLRAQQPAPDAPKEDYVRAHYTKYEFRIPMRDGKRLFTAVYVPKDAAGGPYPFLMDRTPYSVGPYGEDQYPRAPGPLRGVRKERLHLCLPGCARPLDERGRVRRDASAHRREEVARRTWTTPPTPTTPSSFCSSTSPTTTARWASGAFPIPASTPRPPSSTRTRRWWRPARRRP